ncbi:MAG: A/G-specific adenine glycosylase [Burkholderiaceae bacterium]
MSDSEALSADFAARVVQWQRRAGRHGLPWQGQREPYRVWLSEVMLQQTQVATALPYYRRFLQAFPDVEALADAPDAEVMAHWAGLGYYSRARNLLRCARIVAHERDGRFPDRRVELESLPGIGRSTAAAIAVFAFGRREAILDGNVKRVFCRHDAIDGAVDAPATLQRLWQIAEQRLPRSGLETYTQGLMDLGATVCTRSRPDCGVCPLSASCRARALGRQQDFPTPRRRAAAPKRSSCLLILRRTGPNGAQVWLPQRPSTGIWGGLRSLPEWPLDHTEPPRVVAGEDVPWSTWCARIGSGAEIDADGLARHAASRARALPALDHAFTHFRLRMFPWLLDVDGLPPGPLREPTADEQAWADLAAVTRLPLPAPIVRLLSGLSSTPGSDQATPIHSPPASHE